jgi:hypothetical protein
LSADATRGPPEVPPAFIADIPFLSCRRLLPAFFTSTAKGRHSRCGDGYCRLKLERLRLAQVSSNFGARRVVAPLRLALSPLALLLCLIAGLLVLALFYLPYRAPRLRRGGLVVPPAPAKRGRAGCPAYGGATAVFYAAPTGRRPLARHKPRAIGGAQAPPT